jgi:adenylate kinase family enzyme
MKIIGLTGGTGSGKGFVASYLKNNGAYIIDADEIAHRIILKGEPAYKEIVDFYSKQVIIKYDAGVVTFNGDDLVVSKMLDDELLIIGKLSSIEYN